MYRQVAVLEHANTMHERYTCAFGHSSVTALQNHPWFVEGLPVNVFEMNEQYLQANHLVWPLSSIVDALDAHFKPHDHLHNSAPGDGAAPVVCTAVV
jgi:hypothetical protein